jgi:hypothetical protein
MSFRIAINGYGRIGRCFLRALLESNYRDVLSIVAINEPADIDSMAYLTRFDSTHGRFPGTVSVATESAHCTTSGAPFCVAGSESVIVVEPGAPVGTSPASPASATPATRAPTNRRPARTMRPGQPGHGHPRLPIPPTCSISPS